MKLQMEPNIHRPSQMGQALIKYVACRSREESVIWELHAPRRKRAYTEHAQFMLPKFTHYMCGCDSTFHGLEHIKRKHSEVLEKLKQRD